MLSHPVTLESAVRAFTDFRPLLRSLALFDTVSGEILDEKAKKAALNAFLDTGRPTPLYFSLPGLGDSVLLTAVARRHRLIRQSPCLVCSLHAELFRGNPDVAYVLMNHDLTLRSPPFLDFLLQLDIRPVFVAYGVRRFVGDRRAIVAPDCHMIAHMCRMAGLTGEVVLRPWIEDRALSLPRWIPAKREYLVIQSDGRPWKHWGTENFQEIVTGLGSRFLLLHVGAHAEGPCLEGSLDVRGKLFLPELIQVMRGARLFIGNEGGLAHLARAVDVKGVLALSSHVPPAVTGYRANVNVLADTPCDLCASGVVKIYKGEACPCRYRCVAISREAMRAAVEEALDDPAMPVDTHIVPDPPLPFNPSARHIFEQWFAE